LTDVYPDFSNTRLIFEKKVLCPVKWVCVKLEREICPYQEAVYDIKNGWICDCRAYVKFRSTKTHLIFEKGYREGVQIITKNKTNH
jgi:hypothetical protein